MTRQYILIVLRVLLELYIDCILLFCRPFLLRVLLEFCIDCIRLFLPVLFL